MDPKLTKEQVTAYPFTLLSAGITDVGLVRRRNEDAWGARSSHGFYVLADGMGGHQGGDIAAQETVKELLERVGSELEPLPDEAPREDRDVEGVSEWLREAIVAVNAKVYALGRGDPNLRGMGATLCCMLLCGSCMIYSHVGDSRIYRLRRGRLEQLTEDHSLVTELLAMERITEAQAQNFIYRHVITRAIGTRPKVEPAIDWEEARSDDLYMMCSDGLSDLIDSRHLEAILKGGQALDELAHALMEAALKAGGRDNVTVVLVRVGHGKK